MKSSGLLKFSIGTLLVIIAIVAGALAGYQRGFKTGENEWKAMPLITQTYYVGDIVVLGPDNHEPVQLSVDKVADLILRDAVADQWKEASGDKMTFAAFHPSLIVSTNTAVHNEIAGYLNHLREQKKLFESEVDKAERIETESETRTSSNQ